MRYNIEISEEAEIDFDKSYTYYYEESPKVADTFFKSIDLSLEKIRSNPHTLPIIYKNIRKCTIKKFPFVIYYQTTNSIIRVIAIFHSSRNPEIWTNRT